MLPAAPFDMIHARDPILDDIRFLSLETGFSFLSFTPPLSPDEVRQFLNKIDISLLSGPAMDAFDRIENRLIPKANISLSSEYLSLSLNIKSTIEGVFRFNDDIDIVPHNIKIPHLISFPINFYFADFLQLYVEPFIGAAPDFYSTNNNSFFLNTPFDLSLFDDSQPHRAFIAAGGPFWNFQLGRDRLFWGTGNMGSLSFSDNSPYFEFMKFSLFSDFLKYTLMVNQMPLRDVDNIIAPEIRTIIGNDYLRGTTQRHFYVHRLDFNFFNRLSIGFMEGLMVGNSALELRYLNPLMIFHSMSSWFDYNDWVPGEMGSTNGSFLSIEINWNIINSLAFYGQFSMNELSLPGELADRPLQPPNGLGYMAGFKYSYSFENWGSMFFIEFIQTDPYLYLNPSPFASHIQMISLNVTDNQYYYLGYPRDTRTLSVGAHFFNGIDLNFSAELSWISKGIYNTNSVLWNWEVSEEAYNKKTPSGVAENNYILTLRAGWKPHPWITLNGSVSGIMSHNNRHVAGNSAYGSQLILSANFFY